MTFIREDFLLETPQAQELYHGFASDLPIIDYHNHLSPKMIAGDHQFENITQAWLAGDHYKWRAMRALGVEEDYITGTAPDREKFHQWAACVPYCMRNPLYHWTHLELLRYFGIEELLSMKTADAVYQTANEYLRQDGFGARGLLQRMRVEVLCTTDDPADSLEHHVQLQKKNLAPRVFPAFRPDRAYAVSDPAAYRSYLQRLGAASGKKIERFPDLLEALENRMAYFHERGCRLSDHGLESLPYFKEPPEDVEKLFRKILQGYAPTADQAAGFTFVLLTHLCRSYARRGWVQQFHLGALRNTNPRMYERLGPDTGFDSIGDGLQASALAGFLGNLDRTDELAKTVLYNLNPAWNEVFATMAGNFNTGGIRGKIQFGSGWWYNDQLHGMTRQIDTLSNMGILSTFVGMLTDSRSFLSFPRHEYFRRLLCNLFGRDMAQGKLPSDIPHIGQLIRDICYNNAAAYFDFPDINKEGS